MNIKIAIIDDEVNDINQNILILENIENESLTFDIEKFTDKSFDFTNLDFDLYLVDIDMPTVNGIDLAKQINNMNSKSSIIFISRREDLVFNTFSVESLYFVRKDKLKEDLEAAMKKYCNYHARKTNIFSILSDGKLHLVKYKDICYFEVAKNNLEIVTAKGTLTIRKTMKMIMKEIKDDYFVQVHASYYVNYDNVERIEDGFIIMKNHTKLPISRRKLKKAMEKYVEYLFERGGL